MTDAVRDYKEAFRECHGHDCTVRVKPGGHVAISWKGCVSLGGIKARTTDLPNMAARLRRMTASQKRTRS